MKQKIVFITVVWGRTYIDNLVNISLPSYLSEGNIPALAKHFDIEILILTKKNDIFFFKEHEVILDLNKK